MKNSPWVKTYHRIYSRCSKSSNRKTYKDLQIKISISDLKKIWFRDKAWLLKRPSIDRIDNNKGYTFKNCRYIELSENCRKQWDKYKAENRWSKKHDKCVICNSRANRHEGHGRCIICYRKEQWKMFRR